MSYVLVFILFTVARALTPSIIHTGSSKYILMMSDSLDPLENAKYTTAKKSVPPLSLNTAIPVVSGIRQKRDQAELLEIPVLDLNSTERIALVKVRLIELVEQRSENFALEVLIEFQKTMQQYIPIVALFMLTLHVALLIPTIFRLQNVYQESILPFLYIGPVLFTLPYLLFFLWENDILPISYMDDRFRCFLNYLKASAQEQVARDEKALEESLVDNSVPVNSLKDMALMRLLADCNPRELVKQATEAKKALKRGAGKEFQGDRLGPDVPDITIGQDGALQRRDKY